MGHRSAHSSSWDQLRCLAAAKEGCRGGACQSCRLARSLQCLEVGSHTVVEAESSLAWGMRASVFGDLDRRTRSEAVNAKHDLPRVGVDGRWHLRVEEGSKTI